MAERRKIIIETGAQDEPLSTPHFDTEATLTARPVVPLSDQEIHPTNYGDYSRSAAKPFWKRPALLVPIVLVAVGIGVAAGLAIGIYRNRSAAQTPVATAPTPVTENTDLSQTVEPPTPPAAPTPAPQERVTVPAEPEEEPAVEPKEEELERTARNERVERKDNDREAKPPVAVKPPVVREKKPVKVDEYVIEDGREDRQAEREQRREERRAERRERRRRGREDDIIVPRGVQRAGREVERIREIFEGRQP